eukprot:6390419-Amphidinium_carterae.1
MSHHSRDLKLAAPSLVTTLQRDGDLQLSDYSCNERKKLLNLARMHLKVNIQVLKSSARANKPLNTREAQKGMFQTRCRPS